MNTTQITADSTPIERQISVKVSCNGEFYRFQCMQSMKGKNVLSLFKISDFFLNAILFSDLNNTLSNVLPIKGASFVLRYVDDENESIRFTTDLELEEAVRVSKNGVLRISAEQEQQQQQQQPAQAAQKQQQQPQQQQQNVDDVEFWKSLPTWLKEKIIRRHNKQGDDVAAVNSVPLDDARHFTALPQDVRERIKKSSAEHSKKWAERLAKKEEHHRKVAAALEWKSQKLLEKSRNQKEKAEAYGGKGRDLKKVKMFAIEDDNDDGDDVDVAGGRQVENVVVATGAESDRALWSQVPVHVRTRIVARWRPELLADVDAFATFEALPVHVQHRVRHRAQHRFAKFGAAMQPHPPAVELIYANPSFQSAPRATELPIPTNLK